MRTTTELGLQVRDLRQRIEDGSVFAALCGDHALTQKYHVEGSPSYILNEGRQKLFGNIGYNIIAANIESCSSVQME